MQSLSMTGTFSTIGGWLFGGGIVAWITSSTDQRRRSLINDLKRILRKLTQILTDDEPVRRHVQIDNPERIFGIIDDLEEIAESLQSLLNTRDTPPPADPDSDDEDTAAPPPSVQWAYLIALARSYCSDLESALECVLSHSDSAIPELLEELEETLRKLSRLPPSDDGSGHSDIFGLAIRRLLALGRRVPVLAE